MKIFNGNIFQKLNKSTKIKHNKYDKHSGNYFAFVESNTQKLHPFAQIFETFLHILSHILECILKIAKTANLKNCIFKKVKKIYKPDIDNARILSSMKLIMSEILSLHFNMIKYLKAKQGHEIVPIQIRTQNIVRSRLKIKSLVKLRLKIKSLFRDSK